MLNEMSNLKEWLMHNISCIECSDAQQIMMPEGRERMRVFDEKYRKKRESAVAIVFTPDENNYSIYYIKRPQYDGVHSGQVAFPGGKNDKSDKSLLDTAVRECYEEIGVILNDEDCVGRLTDIYIPVSNINVMPYVFVLEKPQELLLDKREVEYVFSVPVRDIVNDSFVSSKKRKFGEEEFDVPFFMWNNECVWGATAMISSELKCILQRYFLESA